MEVTLAIERAFQSTQDRDIADGNDMTYTNMTQGLWFNSTVTVDLDKSDTPAHIMSQALLCSVENWIYPRQVSVQRDTSS